MSYLPSYGTANGSRVMIVKVHPRDVVSVPTDYNFAKARCCRYEVVDEYTGDDLEDLLGTKAVWSDADWASTDEDNFDPDLESLDEDNTIDDEFFVSDDDDSDYKVTIRNSHTMVNQTVVNKVIVLEDGAEVYSADDYADAAEWAKDEYDLSGAAMTDIWRDFMRN